MRIISRKRLVDFWKVWKAGSDDAERYLSAWYKVAQAVKWSNVGDLKQTFGSADQVGNCVVFDVGNNRFRLIGRINYVKGIIYVLKVMDHKEYDKKAWIQGCGCDKPPPKLPSAPTKASPPGTSAPRWRRGRK